MTRSKSCSQRIGGRDCPGYWVELWLLIQTRCRANKIENERGPSKCQRREQTCAEPVDASCVEARKVCAARLHGVRVCLFTWRFSAPVSSQLTPVTTPAALPRLL